MTITRQLFVAAFVFAMGGLQLARAAGNPTPGVAHDTIIIHVQKAESGPKLCTGGHSLFLRYWTGSSVPSTTIVQITMTDWVQLDNDGDGIPDNDLPGDTNGDGNPDDNFDGVPDNDPLEPGAVTTALVCDSYGDNLVKLQIRDTDPRHDYVSTQQWFMRLIGKPQQTFAFSSYANQKITCTYVGPGADGIPGTSDDVASCTTEVGTLADWVKLADFNLNSLGCVKQVKLGGKNGVQAGGKTPFCDITDGFEVDVDTSNDGVFNPNLFDQFVFSISCLDDPATSWDETLYCPLSSVIWSDFETDVNSKAQAQIFVGHVGSVRVMQARIK